MALSWIRNRIRVHDRFVGIQTRAIRFVVDKCSMWCFRMRDRVWVWWTVRWNYLIFSIRNCTRVGFVHHVRKDSGISFRSPKNLRCFRSSYLYHRRDVSIRLRKTLFLTHVLSLPCLYWRRWIRLRFWNNLTILNDPGPEKRERYDIFVGLRECFLTLWTRRITSWKLLALKMSLTESSMISFLVFCKPSTWMKSTLAYNKTG